MADPTLTDAIAEVKRAYTTTRLTLFVSVPQLALDTILNAVLSGDLIPRADAEARGMEMAIKTYRTGAGVDNGNYPLWAYDADYEAAVRKKAEVHRKAAVDRAGRKET